METVQRLLLKSVQISAEWPHRSASFGEKGKLVVGRQDQSMKILQMILYKLIITHHTINWLSSFDDHHIILIAIGHWDQPMKTWYMLQYDGGQPEKMCCFYGQCPNRGRGGDVQPYRNFFVLMTFGKRWSFNNDHCIILLAVGHHEHLVLVHFCFSALPSATL